jgi:replicative DNA helicase
MNRSIVVNEQQLINLIIKEPNLILKVDNKYFLSPISKKIIETINKLYDEQTPVNKDTIVTEGNLIDSTIDEDVLQTIVDKQPVTFDYHYNKLKSNYVKDDYNHNVLKNISSEFQVKTDLDLNNLDKLGDKLQEYKDILKPSYLDNQIYSMSDAFQEYINILYDRARGERYFSTGCSYLDRHIYRGFAPQEMTAIYGDSGVGKSTFAQYLFRKQKNRSIPVIYFTPENSLEITLDRQICMDNRIPFKFLYPNLNEFKEIPQYIFDIVQKEKIKYEKQRTSFICDEPIISIKDLKKYITDKKREYRFEYMVCYLDLASMFKEFNLNSGNKASDYENALNTLHFTAKETNCHFVNVFQMRRPNEKVSVKKIEDLQKFKPQIETIKNSGAIKERHRCCIGVFRAKYYAQAYLPEESETDVMDDIMEIMIQKQNVGGLAHLKYFYDPETYYINKYLESEKEEEEIPVLD